ncbi:T9SS-dependent choice-of-anchor J family protein [Winogradskyella endarachnes]|uniref:Omp28-related outer membrane protein n=1 Tax=Winogradskyella endarachnes TaxID=2681965 RepID=A0A6L6U6R4_9FLAO|nr:choice-of-anchor J domain-containing protein [Winogradskyella endarachnes]MUU77913.1 Omp28-related outer membrane protein [Winogradskyella endarachnes]
MIKKITLSLLLCLTLSQLATAQTIFTEGFEGASFPPTGWTSFMGTNGVGTANDWIQVTYPNTGTYAAANIYENVAVGIAEDWLVTSQIDLTSATNAELRFYSTETYTSTNYGSTYEVKVSTTSQTTHADFTTVASYTEANIGSGWTLQSVDLSAYDGMMVYIAFVHYNDDGDNWVIDDIEVRSPLNLDAELENVSLNRYALISTDNLLSFDVFNNGISTITSLDVSWSDGTNTYSENFTVNIAPGATETVNHTTPVNYSTVEEKNISVTINNVNSSMDGDSSNNSLNTDFNTVSQSGIKAVFIEEATGTWCGWCPRGAVGLDYMTSTYPNTVVGVAVHNADPMVLTEYDAGIGNYISGYPSGAVDRKYGDVNPSQANLQAIYDALNTEIVPVDLSIGATQNGNDLIISAQSNFYSNFSNANFRLGVIITEDGVTGTGDGTNTNNQDYDQVNYYAGGANGVMGGYENLGDPVPATQMVYNHVGIALLGGFYGQENSVPSIINNGDSASYNFNYTIPTTSTESNIHIVAVLLDATDGSVVGAKQATIAEALSVEEVSGIDSIKIHPNPAKDRINISFQESNGDYNVTVTDMLGRTVINTNYEGLFGIQNIELPISNLNAGHYVMHINDGNRSYSSKFIVNK